MKSIRGMLPRLPRYQVMSGILLLMLFSGILFAQVASPHVKFEAEAGTPSGQAAPNGDLSASNGQYLGFTSATQPGVQFFEDFKTDQRARFDWQLQTTLEPPQRSFLGEHDTNCGSGTNTTRTVHPPVMQSGTIYNKLDLTSSEMVWWCADAANPNGGHMMTGLDTDSITYVSFSPKQAYSDIKKVCWDQSMMYLAGGKWNNMLIVPNADVVAKGNNLSYISQISKAFAVSNQFLPPGAVDFTWERGSTSSHKVQSDGSYLTGYDQWQSDEPSDTNGNGEVGPGDTPSHGMATDPGALYTICVDDGNNKVTIERPNGALDTFAYNIAFPTGPVRVIFQDSAKSPTKYGPTTYKHLTMHWDNITVE